MQRLDESAGPGARLKIGLVAYVCGPEEGSEPGTAWAWARMLATFADVTLITIDEEPRASETDRQITALGLSAQIHHLTIPFPGWWPHGMRRFERLSYLAWQLGMPAQVDRLGLHFDLAWHVTLANAWLGSLAYRLSDRFVLGPVGGGVGTPWRVTPALGGTGFLFEVNRTIARFAGRWLNPLSRAAWNHAELILAQNRETASWLPVSARSRVVIFPHVAVEMPTGGSARRSPARSAMHDPGPARRAITVGRLVPWKGIALAIRAMSYLPDWHLTVIGDGPDRGRLEHLAIRRGLAGRIDFGGWLSRDAVQEQMRQADVLLFPSLHEEGGWASAEAIAAGIPVVSLDRGGPPSFGARGIAASWPEATARAIARAAHDEVDRSGRQLDDTWSFSRRRDALGVLIRERGLLPR